MNHNFICKLLSTAASRNEADLHVELTALFNQFGVYFVHEYIFDDKTKADFLIGSDTVLEVKCNGTREALLRQLHGYAGQRYIKRLILLTTKHQFKALPLIINGKPLTKIILHSWI